MDFSLPKDSIVELAGPLDPHQSEQLAQYGRMVLAWSDRVNVVSRQSLGALREHFVDSAALLSFKDVDGDAVGDLGSGAGFPGLVVAVLRPRAQVTLIDSRRRKVVFLKSVVRELGLENVEVLHARIEDLDGHRAFDLAVVRALDRCLDLLPGCLRLVSPSGSLVLFKGPRWVEEAPQVAAAAKSEGFKAVRIEEVALPGLARTTTFVELSPLRG